MRGTTNFKGNRNYEYSSDEGREVGGGRSTGSNAGLGSRRNEEYRQKMKHSLNSSNSR